MVEVTYIAEVRKALQGAKDSSHLSTGGGDGTYDPMEPRVAALEKAFDRIDGKMDALIKDVAEIKGRINAMPSTIQLLAFVVAIFVAAGILKYFGH